jgi:hypothetical protein
MNYGIASKGRHAPIKEKIYVKAYFLDNQTSATDWWETEERCKLDEFCSRKIGFLRFFVIFEKHRNSAVASISFELNVKR